MEPKVQRDLIYAPSHPIPIVSPIINFLITMVYLLQLMKPILVYYSYLK